MKHGVPQGSILGPFVHNVLNDLSLQYNDCTIYKYADDSTLLAKGKTVNDVKTSLNNDLNNIERSCKYNFSL